MSNDISVSNIPSSQERPVSYRSITNSSEQNISQEEALNDILDLFNKANKIEKAMSEIVAIMDTENKYLQLRLSITEAQLAGLAQDYRNATAQLTDSKYITMYPTDATVDNTEDDAYIDLQNMDITISPVQVISKVGLFDAGTGTTFLPASLDVELGPDTLVVGGNILSIEDNDVLNAFAGDSSAYWVRKIVTNNNVSEIVCEMTITLPEDIITTRDINCLIINGYPINALDIMNIEYKANGAWTTLDCFAEHSAAILEEYSDVFGTTYSRPVIEDASSLKFNFKEISANQLKITFRQRHYLQDQPTQRIFYLGAKNIQVLQNKYGNDYNTFNMTVNFPDTGSSITLQDTEVILNNPGEMDSNVELVQQEYYYLDGGNVPHKITDTIPLTLPTNDLLIKFKLFKGLATPNIRAIKVKYKDQ